MTANRKNWQMCFACGFVTIMGLIVAAAAWLTLFDKPYLSYRNLPFPPTIAQVHAGEIIPLSIEHCNADDVSHNYKTTHALKEIDTNTFTSMPDVRVLIPPGCTSSISLINQLPEHLPPGRYIVFGTSEVPGFLRTHHVEWESQPFDVVERKQ